MNTSKGSEQINKDGGVEIKVQSVDYRSPAGHDKEDKPEKKNVEVTHIIDPQRKDLASDYANPGEALSSRVESAKPVSSKQDN
ncbi:hypothetical protein QVD17_16141 [Tagetes erecta]|uniref:Uncharacterized protein n=1 Tax=Tagetes erecta TaxID=13708 RepID=A0AAD8NT88_TARER|nr:hypothetical protein QVD17_16141 [Tagetes erecta]